MTRWMTAAAAIALLTACSQEPAADDAAMTDAAPADEAADTGAMDEPMDDAGDEISDMDADMDADSQMADSALNAEAQEKLDSVLSDARRDDDRARDEFRHPGETLAFFGIEPDMTVAEALPGGGWYTRVLLPYLTPEGRYIALNYQTGVWEGMYGDNWNDDAAAEIAGWTETAPAKLMENGPDGAEVEAYVIGATPASLDGQVDAVLFVRALHHLNRFDVAYMDEAVADSFEMLKPGGVVGVVQHRANATASDDYASGDNGYLREADVIAAFERGGFELDSQSGINANPADTADYEDGVWTLPPSGGGGEEYADIGESDRMTLKFRKPE